MENKLCQSCFREFEGALCPHCGGIRNEEHQLPIGTILHGRYQIGRVLGQGGFGITYLGRDRLLGNTVAVKEFFPGSTVFRKNEDSLSVSCINRTMVPHFNYSKERFLREASALVRFRDLPEVVDILDFSEENGTAYIVMEYVKGVDLAKYVQHRGGRLSVEETFRILRPVMEALGKVHRGGIIHRDISPDNIILDPMGGAKLLDFGAVRAVEDPNVEKGLNKSTEAILKQGFAPIEQYNTRGSLGPWSDEYAMCATVWYCLTGTVPTEASTRLSEGIDPDWSSIEGLPEHQQQALAKGFSCRAKDRYESMDALLAALFPDRETASAPVPPVQYTPSVNILPDPAPQPVPQFVPQSVPQSTPQFEPQPVPQPAPQPAQKTEKKSHGKWKLFLGIGLGAAAVAAAVVILILTAPARKYNAASSLLAKGRYEEAIEKFSELGTYSDSRSRIKECNYIWAEQLLQEGAYEEAADKFTDLKSYEDAREMAMECHYLWAEQLLREGQIQEAADKFAGLGNYKDSPSKVLDCRYAQAELLLKDGMTLEAALAFGELGDHADARERSVQLWSLLASGQFISAGDYHTLALMADGTVVAAGKNDKGQCDVEDWTSIVAVFAGDEYSVGLRSDGTVVATGDNEKGQCDVTGMRGVLSVSAGYSHTVFLMQDGTVVTVGDDYTNSDYKGARSDADRWTGIIAVSAGGGHTVGLKSDGTVVASGYNKRGECEVDGWTDIIAISTGTWHTVGLRADGTVVAVGYNSSGQCEVDGWTDIVAICAGKEHTVGLKADGTVVTTGSNSEGQCDVADWTDIVAICAGEFHTVGLKSDGTLVAVGKHSEGQCGIDGLKGLRTNR